MRTLLPLLLISSCSLLTAQSDTRWISFGAKGGVPISSLPGNGSESRRYTIGPSVEFRLPANFAVEVSALYQRVGSSYALFYSPVFISNGSDVVPLTSTASRNRTNSWRFPILGKYYFGNRSSRWQPFLGTGYAFEAGWTHSDYSTVTDGVATKGSFNDRGEVNVGAVAAAGVRINAGRFSVLPEFRYTRWGSSPAGSTRRNEGLFLLGIQF
jgi:hypothetical protein